LAPTTTPTLATTTTPTASACRSRPPTESQCERDQGCYRMSPGDPGRIGCIAYCGSVCR
jgi:hypothetical protein